MEYLYGHDERVIPWAQSRIRFCTFRDDAKAIGAAIDGKIVGAFVYDLFSMGSCFVNIASDGSKRWMTREFVIRAMAFPFLQCKFNRINAIISEHNADSIRFCLHFGAKVEGRLREAGPLGEDMLLLGALRRECPYLPENRTRWRERPGGAILTQSFVAGKSDPGAL